VMRSIETDRWTARVSNTGYSGIIDAHGNTKWISNLHQFQTYRGEIYRRNTMTFYVVWGDWLIKLLTILFFIYWFLRI
ncbi:MAG: apolipoprotein N-acyltransferase, partial [Geminocystis sp. GBBB08]|nr:apolipoprotein N-acyltransferase [Geminocystis sp. GBBB08]